MHVTKRVLAAVAASALVLPVAAAAPALAAQGEAAPPAPRSIAAFCAAVPTTYAPFTDAGGTFLREINCLSALRITRGGPGGLPADRFGPALDVRRDSMASFLVRLADRAEALDVGGSVRALPPAAAGGFSDVPAANVHRESIRRLSAAGIVQGGPGGRPASQYGPTLQVTRGQMASLIVRTLEYVLRTDLSVPQDYFVDDAGLPVHEPNINVLAATAIGVGDGRDRFQPASSVRRDQMAGMLTRTLAYLQAEGRISAFDPVVPMQLLGINDFHGHLDPPASTAAVQTSVAGRLAGVVNAMRAEVPGTAFVSAGDNIGASPFLSAVARDTPTIEALNAMGLDVSAVGNHEFDRGHADLAVRVRGLADFPYLGANVEGERPELESSSVMTNAAGVRIGFIGVVTAETGSLVAPAGIEGITFTDPVAAANREAARLTDGDESNLEADVVVLLAHEGAATAATTPEACAAIAAAQDDFGRIIRDSSSAIDVILGGHTHLRVDCEYPNPGGRGSVRPVLEAAQYGTALARLRFSYDVLAERISGVDGQVLALTEAAFPGVTDPAVEAIVDRAEAAAFELGSPVIGTITTDIRRAVTSTGAEDRGAESVLGNFIADVQLEAANQPGRPGAQIAFMNPGGLRADFLVAEIYNRERPGEVTVGEAGAVQPFANTLFTLTLTGAQVKQVLEEQYQPASATRPFLALGVSQGLFFRYDDAAPAGSRISGITLNGTPLDPAGSYRIVTNSFLASGGDNFATLATGTSRTDTGLDDLTALRQYFERNTPVTPDPAPRRQAVPATP
jgi:2',3'-cyclic-nucleotide 2'-phosphodiesterase (5'-nucleotidase family)